MRSVVRSKLTHPPSRLGSEALRSCRVYPGMTHPVVDPELPVIVCGQSAPAIHPELRFGYTGDDGEMVCFGTQSGNMAQGMLSLEQVDHVSVSPLSSDASMATPACASMRSQLQGRHSPSPQRSVSPSMSSTHQVATKATLDWNGCANNLGLKAKYGK